MKQVGAGFWGFLILFAGIIGLREMQWWQVQQGIRPGASVDQVIRLAEPIRVTPSNCIISARGQSVLVRRELCDQSHLQRAEMGDEVHVVGTWDRWMIEDQTQEKDWIKAQKVTVKKFKPLPAVSYWWWLRKLSSIAQKIGLIYKANLPEPQASLVAGIVIGEQGNLPTQFKQDLQRTGTTHMIAASGYNVTVVAGVVMGVAVGWWGRRKGVLITGVAVLLYMLLAGGNPPIVRAGLMGVAMLVGVAMGREYWAGWALVIVSGLMLMLSPWLITSVSFQLSAAATVGMIGGAKPIEAGMRWMGRWGVRRLTGNKVKAKPRLSIYLESAEKMMMESLSTTLAAVVMTAPISLIAFGQVSWWGVVVNPLVLWLVPPLMYLGSSMALLGFIGQTPATMAAWTVVPLATLMVEIIETAGRVSTGLFAAPINWWIAAGWWLVWLSVWGIGWRRTA